MTSELGLRVAVQQGIPSGQFVYPKVEVVGHPDKKVPLGETIQLQSHYKAECPGQPWYAPEWAVSVVAYDEPLTTILGKNDTTHFTEGPVTNDPYLYAGTMPNYPIWIGVVLWGNPDAWKSFPEDGGNWTQLDFHWLYLEPEEVVVGWQLLDSRAIAVKSKPSVVGWQLLDSRAIAVKSKPPVVGWQLLDEKTVGITVGPPEEIPPEYELIQETVYPWAYVFEGEAEVCTFEFRLTPEQIPGTEWLGERIVDSFVSELEKEGSRLLELKVYRDTTPMFWTNYRVEVTATASPLAWNLIILGVLAIVFIVAIIFAIKAVESLIYHRKGLDEETKKTFSRDTLIAMILDLAPETPPETLEAMSDQELRDLLNQLIAEVAPPVSWLPLVLVGVLGVLGVGAAVAFSMARPRE